MRELEENIIGREEIDEEIGEIGDIERDIERILKIENIEKDGEGMIEEIVIVEKEGWKREEIEGISIGGEKRKIDLLGKEEGDLKGRKDGVVGRKINGVGEEKEGKGGKLKLGRIGGRRLKDLDELGRRGLIEGREKRKGIGLEGIVEIEEIIDVRN